MNLIYVITGKSVQVFWDSFLSDRRGWGKGAASPSSSPPIFIAEHDVGWCGISLWPGQGSCPGCIHSQSLANPQPTQWECSEWRENGKALAFVKAVFSKSNYTAVLSTLFQLQIQNSTTWAAEKVNSVLCRGSTGIQEVFENTTFCWRGEQKLFRKAGWNLVSTWINDPLRVIVLEMEKKILPYRLPADV